MSDTSPASGFIKKIAEYSLLLSFMALICYLLYRKVEANDSDQRMRVKSLEVRLDQCSKDNINILREEMEKNRDVIEANTEAFREFRRRR